MDFFGSPYPLGEQKAAFEVDSSRRVGSVKALRADRPLEFHQDSTIVRFVVPSVIDYEVIALTVA